MLRLRQSDYDRILDHARAGLPNESCGLIGGTIEDNIRCVRQVYLLNNLDASPEHFSMDPGEQLKAVRDMRANGFVQLGNFHSHPDTPSRPSAEDIRLAFDSKASYLIFSLENRESPVLRAFRIIAGQAEQEEIQLI